MKDSLPEEILPGTKCRNTAAAPASKSSSPIRRLPPQGEPWINSKPPTLSLHAPIIQRQSRAIAEGRNSGLLHIYVDKTDARILGGEMIAPEAEHLAQLVALAIHREMTVHDMLTMPFYHPTVEEGLRTALRDAAQQLAHIHTMEELTLCESCPELPLC